MLEVDAVDAFYGASQVLFGASLHVEEGQIVTLMGRNGMGKTTLVRTILGMMKPRSGRISFRGQETHRWESHRIARLGIGVAPEGRQVFPLLSVEENLVATSRPAARSTPSLQDWSLASVYELFPGLKQRAGQAATTLSGGEQQMLSIGRALMTNPSLLILDEATEGLAPLIREEIWTCIMRLRRSGLSILIIDKNLDELLWVTDRHFIIEKGTMVWSGSSAELRAQPEIVAMYLGV
ncbi:MAG: ABC transporter ATP-binding protein [Betaproteobacteria bacterium]|nr:ABC transporter ATP-binding protein [Betaproteobacteria bacterium]